MLLGLDAMQNSDSGYLDKMGVLSQKSNEESERSNVDYKLRHENFILKQEILQLRKALFMNNNNQIEETRVDQSQQEQDEPRLAYQEQNSPTVNINKQKNRNIVRDTPSDSEYFKPQNYIPQPYQSIPKKPEINSTLNSTQKQINISSNDFKNLLNNIPIFQNQKDYEEYHDNIDFQTRNQSRITEQGDSIDIKINTQRLNQLSKQTSQNQLDYFHQDNPITVRKNNQFQALRQNEDQTNLRMTSRNTQNEQVNSSLHNVDSDQNILNNISLSRDDFNESKELQFIEDQLKARGYIERNDFLNSNTLNEDKKRSSSVFEIKRHYELEIENLKKDLEIVQKEEKQIKQKIEKQNFPLSKEFTFKNDSQKKQFVKELDQYKRSHVNSSVQKIDTYVNNDSKSIASRQPQSIKQESNRISQGSKHSRYMSNDFIHESQNFNNPHQNQILELSNKWQPPSFNNSHLNTNQNSPDQSNHAKKYVKFSDVQIIRSCESSSFQDQTQQSEEDYVNQRLDTDIINKIFESKAIQMQFQSLDHYSRQPDQQLVCQNSGTFNQFMKTQKQSQLLESMIDSSFGQQMKSEQSSFAIVRAQDQSEKLRMSQSEAFFNHELLHELSPNQKLENLNNISIDSSNYQGKIEQYIQTNKDNSPSFGEQKIYKSIYETSESQTSKHNYKTNYQTAQQNKSQNNFKRSSVNSNYQISQINSVVKQIHNKNVSFSKSPAIIEKYKFQMKPQSVKKNNFQGDRNINSQSVLKNQRRSVLDLSQSKQNDNQNKQSSKNSSIIISEKPNQQKKLIQSRSQLLFDQSPQKSVYRNNKEEVVQQNILQRDNYNSVSVKSLIFNQSSIIDQFNHSQINSQYNKYNSNYDNIRLENMSSFLDTENLQDFRMKSALKRRNELFQRKEAIQKAKLDDKMAKIEALQKQKVDQRNNILDRRCSKSPSRNHNYNSTTSQDRVMNQYASTTSIKYQQPLKTPQPSSPSNQYNHDKNNSQLQKEIFMTLFNNARNVEQLNSMKQTSQLNQQNNIQTSRSISKTTSRRVTENNTPLASTRRSQNNKEYSTNSSVVKNSYNNNNNNSVLKSATRQSNIKENTCSGKVQDNQYQSVVQKKNESKSFLKENLKPSKQSLFKKLDKSQEKITGITKAVNQQFDKGQYKTASKVQKYSPISVRKTLGKSQDKSSNKQERTPIQNTKSNSKLSTTQSKLKLINSSQQKQSRESTCSEIILNLNQSQASLNPLNQSYQKNLNNTRQCSNNYSSKIHNPNSASSTQISRQSSQKSIKSVTVEHQHYLNNSGIKPYTGKSYKCQDSRQSLSVIENTCSKNTRSSLQMKYGRGIIQDNSFRFLLEPINEDYSQGIDYNEY
eukprot:403368070